MSDKQKKIVQIINFFDSPMASGQALYLLFNRLPEVDDDILDAILTLIKNKQSG